MRIKRAGRRFDKIQTGFDRDIGIFMELARTDQARKMQPRP